MINESDLRSIIYFWQEKGDITRMMDYEKVLVSIEKEYPEIVMAIRQFIIAQRLLDRLIKSLQVEIDYQ